MVQLLEYTGNSLAHIRVPDSDSEGHGVMKGLDPMPSLLDDLSAQYATWPAHHNGRSAADL
jgi:hypothetical protein